MLEALYHVGPMCLGEVAQKILTSGGNLTLILPSNIKTRDLRFEYRGNLLSTKVTSRSTLHITVRNRKGKVVR